MGRDVAIIQDRDLLDLLACSIDARPLAPGPDDLRPFIVGIARGPQTLVVHFDSAVAELLTSFVEAERQCCPDIGWEIIRGPALRIAAPAAQLDALVSLFEPASAE